jgi:large subunit ribosomal protein L21
VDYAIVRAGGLQFRVSEGDRIRVPRMVSGVGEKLTLDQVLAVSRNGELAAGAPLVDGASVSAEVVGHGRGKKIIVYKKKRRKGYQRKAGHRQGYTELLIKGISHGRSA